MDEMLRFLFKSTMQTDSALRAIAKTFKHQRKFNRCVLLTYLVLGAGYFENQHGISALKREISLMKEPTENSNDDTRR